jgi:alpha-beta hydrolase superfamily lysophospholipase
MPLKSFLSALAHRVRKRTPTFVISSTLLSVVTAAGCGQLVQKERELTFRVEPGTAHWYTGLPRGLVESNLPVAAGGQIQQIHTWWWPAHREDAPAVLYLHGARWNLTGHLVRIRQLRDFGFSVLAIDYRGFGKSDGDYPTEQSVYEDARVAWDHLARLQPEADKRFIYGHSLGGAVAVDLAAHLAQSSKEPAAGGLIVESSFSSLSDIARTFTYPWLPVQLLMSQKFDSVDKIGRVEVPVLIVHGSEDRYVPAHLSEKLYAAAQGRKKLLVVAGATHNNSMRIGEDSYRSALAELFGRKLDDSSAKETLSRR